MASASSATKIQIYFDPPASNQALTSDYSNLVVQESVSKKLLTASFAGRTASQCENFLLRCAAISNMAANFDSCKCEANQTVGSLKLTFSNEVTSGDEEKQSVPKELTNVRIIKLVDFASKLLPTATKVELAVFNDAIIEDIVNVALSKVE